MSKKFAVILSGCGVYDGAEIHEATLSLLAIDQAGASYQCFAPDMNQMHVVNHISGEELDETRNVLIESARIARGNIQPLSQLDTEDFDAILLPGGFGAAKNLSDFAMQGGRMSVNRDVEKALTSMHKSKKPIGALCIAPVILAKLFERAHVTVGGEGDASAAIETMDATHEITNHVQITIDEQNNLITSPGYMLDASISQIYNGARAVINEILRRI